MGGSFSKIVALLKQLTEQHAGRGGQGRAWYPRGKVTTKVQRCTELCETLSLATPL